MASGSKGSLQDKQKHSFVDSPTRDSSTAQEVFVGNSDINSIPVELSEAGTSFIDYAESLSVSGLDTTTIITYTVPVDKNLKLKGANFSGENRAVYEVQINGSTKVKHRTYFTNYNGSIEFKDTLLVSGDVVRILVENKTNSISDFNATIQGNLRDAGA